MPLPELEQAFEAWQVGKGAEVEGAGGTCPATPRLVSQGEFGKATSEQLTAVRFCARGEDSTLDAARRFRLSSVKEKERLGQADTEAACGEKGW